MSTSGPKPGLSRLLLWGGLALVVVGLALSVPQIVLYAETMLYSERIPTAPVLDTAATVTTEPLVLLPQGDGDETAVVPPEPQTPSPSSVDVATVTPDVPMPAPTVTPSPTPVWEGTIPLTVSIPAIQLVAPIVPIGWSLETVGGESQAMWDVPDWRAAGWHNTSANIGVTGNTVLNGHNTSKGEVFRDLYKVEVGAEISIEGEDGKRYTYRVGEKYILREAGQPLSVRRENARYIQETPDERLTLVTCHPYGSLANRLVVIAYPDGAVDAAGEGTD